MSAYTRLCSEANCALGGADSISLCLVLAQPVRARLAVIKVSELTQVITIFCVFIFQVF